MQKVTKAALTRMVEGLVSEGVRVLDEYFDTHEDDDNQLWAPGGPPWRDRIDVRTLDVESIALCPLAQVFGGYGYGLRTLFGHMDYDRAAFYGFNVVNTVQAQELLGVDPEDGGWYLSRENEQHLWDELKRLWRRAVRNGRPAVNAVTS